MRPCRTAEGGGAIVIGKTFHGRLAAGSVGSTFGIARNPYEPARSPSGFAGASGIGLAARTRGADTGTCVPKSLGNLRVLRRKNRIDNERGSYSEKCR